jgi:hypothetical protein
MKFNKLAVLVGILILLAGLAFVKKHRDADREEELAFKLPQESVLSYEISPASVQKIIAEDGEAGGKIIFVKDENAEWFLDSYYGVRARKDATEGILKTVRELKGEIRSDSPEVLKDYLLTDEKSVHLKLLGPEDAEKAHLLVSRLKPAAEQNFVRLSGANKVYAAYTDVLFALGLYDREDALDAKRFADLQLVKLEPSQITGLQLTDRGRSVILNKKEDPSDKQAKWFIGSSSMGSKADEGKVNRVISAICNIYAKAALDPKGAGYRINESSAWVSGDANKDGRQVHFELYLGLRDSGKKSYFVKVMPGASVYEVGDENVDAIKSHLSGGF